MIAAIPGYILELAVGLAAVTVGCVLFFVGNRLFGRKTGGKRLVVFAAGIVGIITAYFLLRWAFSGSDAAVVAVLFGGACFLVSVGLLVAAFSPEERLQEAFNIVLRSF